MPRSPHQRRTVLTLLSVGMLGVAIVLGLWQQVDRACRDGLTDRTDPVAACDVPLAEVEQVPGGTATDADGVPLTTVSLDD